MKHFCLFIIQFYSCLSFPITKPKLTLDEFLDSTTYTFLKFSPTGQHLLIETLRASWNTSSYENSLWIYDIQQQTKKLITKNPHKTIKPQWSPNGNWIVLLLDENSPEIPKPISRQQSFHDFPPPEQHIYLYSLISNDLLPIQKAKDIPLALTWSNSDFSLYLATTSFPLEQDDEWRDVIQYREMKNHQQTIIYRIDINEHNYLLTVKKHLIKNISSLIGELLYVPFQEKLLFTTVSSIVETLEDFELYAIDLLNTSLPIVRLTDNEVLEKDLQISIDGTHVLFQTRSLGSTKKNANDTQGRLYSLDLINGRMTRLAEKFDGNINEYHIKSDDNVYILGQLGTETQIYSQGLYSKDFKPYLGWNGTYESVTLSDQNAIAFIYSSTEKPMEIYLIDNIDQLPSAKAITNENQLYTERDLPQAKVYRWENPEDHQVIEGMLHYPPGQFEMKKLPLLILIHGGPHAASANRFSPDWYTWAPLAATEGWLVLEPNYRGSTGYGDQFLNELRYRPVSLPGKDILYGVDQLIHDGIVDPYRLAIGGYSYGGFLTNWLITQTKRFNAALSGAGAIDHLSAWGTMDLPVHLSYLFGGYPWESPHIYQNEAPIYQLDRVRTPTLIITGDSDIRVPASQSYIMERALHYRGVPVQLVTFPNEGHDLLIDPWHGKIKIREELKWLKKYGTQL